MNNTYRPNPPAPPPVTLTGCLPLCPSRPRPTEPPSAQAAQPHRTVQA